VQQNEIGMATMIIEHFTPEAQYLFRKPMAQSCTLRHQ
jgi:hypothetical protein